MKVKHSELKMAFDFLNSQPSGINSVYLCRKTSKFFYSTQIEIANTLPRDIDNGNYICLPHRKELELGRFLAIRFVTEFMPEDVAKVDEIFCCRGAYRRFKGFLRKKRQLDQWYRFEEIETEKAMGKWREDHQIEIDRQI